MESVNDIAREISILVPKMMRNVKAEFFTRVDFTTSQFIIMVSLHERKSVSSGKLAREHNLSNPTITGIVDRLTKQGYVRRLSDVKDRRKVLVSLTIRGKETVKKFQKLIQQRWKDILRHLTKKEQQTSINVFRKLNKIVSDEVLISEKTKYLK